MTEISSTPRPTPSPANDSMLFQIRRYLFVLLEYPHFTSQSKIVYWIIVTNVLASVTLTITLSAGDTNYQITKWIDLVFSIVFNTEFLVRFGCQTAYGLPLKNYLQSPYFIVDSLSGLPFVLEIINATPPKIKSILRFIRILPVLKILRYLEGLEIVFKGVKSSIRQFWTVLIALLITILGFGITIFYSEISYSKENEYESTNIYSVSDSMWLVIVTLTTTGYGDKSPKTLVGRGIAIVLSFIGNSIILALPIAIIGLDFSKAYNEDQEQKKQEELNVKYLIQEGNSETQMKKVQLKYMYNRLNEIEARNKKLTRMLEQSNIVTRELTSQMEELMMKLGGEMGMPDLILIVRNKQISGLRRPAQMGTKIQIFDKFMKAKKKIKISNLLKNIKKNTISTVLGKMRSPERKKTIRQIFVKTTKDMITQQNIIKLLQEMTQPKLKISGIQRREPRFHSVGNENLILRKRNEELGHLAFEFLNDINSSEISESSYSKIQSSQSESALVLEDDANENIEEVVLSFQNRKSLAQEFIDQQKILYDENEKSVSNEKQFGKFSIGINNQKEKVPEPKNIISFFDKNRYSFLSLEKEEGGKDLNLINKKNKMETQKVIKHQEIINEQKIKNIPPFHSRSNQISKL